MSNTTIVIVPGLRDAMPEHWQSLLEAKLPNALAIPPLAGDKLDLQRWIETIEQHLAQIDGPVILVAHSAGVLAVAHWAARHSRPIKGALLVTPPDVNASPSADALRANGWSPLPAGRLPFPSIVVASSNDPMAALAAVTEMAQQWGSELIDVGAVGHLNPASGYGEWPQAQTLIAQLVS